MEPLSPWTVYWIMQADMIRGAMFGLSIIFVIIVAFLAGLCCWAYEEDIGDDASRRRLVRRTIFGGVSCIAFLASTAFVPTTKTLAAMYVLPRIVNNESVQQEAGELYDLAKEALKEMAGDNKGTQ